MDEDWKRVDVEEQKHLERKSNIRHKLCASEVVNQLCLEIKVNLPCVGDGETCDKELDGLKSE